MNYRNCVYFKEVESDRFIWSRCLKTFWRCSLYKNRIPYPDTCEDFEPTFKSLVEEAIENEL